MEDNIFSKPVQFQDILTENEIMTRSKDVDPKAVAGEIISWLSDNVENYVDNHRTVYRLYLTVGTANSMPATGLLQLLYMSIPTAKDGADSATREAEGRCLDVLDDITAKVKECIMYDKEGLKGLYDRLIYYFEMTGFSSQSGPIIQQFDGHVEVSEFIYEPLSMEVVVSAGADIVDVDGNHVGQSKPKEVIKREMMPEGFAVEFELKYWKRPTAELY
jgi:hypothetical protein